MFEVKKFKLFINESISEDDDMFAEFIDAGFTITTHEVYYTDDRLKDGNYTYDEPRYDKNEKTGTLLTIRDNNSDKYITLDNYINKQKEFLDILDKIIYRSNVKVMIENYIPNLIFEGIEHTDDTKVILDDLVKQIENFANSKFPEIEPNRNFTITRDGGKVIRIKIDGARQVFDQERAIKTLMSTKSFRDKLSKINNRTIREIPKKMLSSGVTYNDTNNQQIYIKLLCE